MKYILIILSIIILSCIFNSTEAIQKRSSRIQLSTRIRDMVSDKINNKQIMTLTTSLADLIISNYPITKLKYELAERLFTALKPVQNIQLIGAFECYQNNIGEAETKNLFLKTGEVISTFISPSFMDIYGQLQTFRTLGFTSEEQRNSVLTRLNLIFSEGMIRNIFSSLTQRLTKKEISFHKNCGGRIIKFNKYFVIEPLK